MSTLTSTNIRQNLVAFFGERFPLFDPDTPDNVPLQDHGVDSLGVTEIVLYIEEQFHFEVADTELTRENLGTVQALVSYIARKQKAS